jgi:uncharacterized protein (TIGR00251 family)
VAAPFHPHPDGVVVEVWVVPGASRSGVVGLHGDALKVRVAAPPERNRANAALEDLLAAAAAADRAAVVAGGTGRRKRVLLEGVSAADAEARLLGGHA